MFGNSQRVESRQTQPHRDLSRLLERHLAHPFRKPVAEHSQVAFAQFLRVWGGQRPLVLDSGCGTGESTLNLAHLHPDATVVGVDQSAHRLARGPAHPNMLLLRADVVDFWRLMAAQRITLAAHYILYPNPWPKPHHVMRRWPGHPVFPVVLALGGRLECRTNWQVYAEEFALVAGLLRGTPVASEVLHVTHALTPFERKYVASGHAIFRVVVPPTHPAHSGSPPHLNGC
jgi:tRNA (guanine-N7-)-methyltransferase